MVKHIIQIKWQQLSKSPDVNVCKSSAIQHSIATLLNAVDCFWSKQLYGIEHEKQHQCCILWGLGLFWFADILLKLQSKLKKTKLQTTPSYCEIVTGEWLFKGVHQPVWTLPNCSKLLKSCFGLILFEMTPNYLITCI